MNRNLRTLCFCSIFAALIAVCAQIVIPLPAVPISLALLPILLAGSLLGPWYGTLSVLIYILLGLIGVPVFAGFGSGVGVLFCRTGGYIIGYLFASFAAGVLSKVFGRGFWRLCLAMACGVLLCYLFGTVWYMRLTASSLATSLTLCVLPFIPGDCVKVALASYLTQKLLPVFKRNRWLPESGKNSVSD